MVKDTKIIKSVKESAVLSACREELSSWQERGVVISFTRVNSGKIETKWGTWIQLADTGTPDIFAFLNINGHIHVYFIEGKRPVGGVWGYEQQEFKYKYRNVKGVTYELVEDVTQVTNTILKLTGSLE